VTIVLVLALTALALPTTLCAAYLLALTLLSGRLPVPSPASAKLRFRIMVPAHDESAGIAGTVESLLAIDYPRELFDVLVIADNCKDDTAARARAAGALVLERTSETERGKGYALHYAFERLPKEVDAAVVIDADTLVSRNLLQAFAARIEAGAVAVQADYAVRNPNAAWRTRLIAIAFGAFHIVRSRARERLRVSAGLRGNGMCFAAGLLRTVPHQAFSIVEDVEYGIRIAEAGHRVVYADDAHVYGEMVATSAAASSQRTRWEGGRAALTRKYAPGLLRRGLAGDPIMLDLAFDILVPPLSKIAVMTASGLVVSGAAAYFLGGFAVAVQIFSASAASIVIYVLRGWTLSGTGLRGLADLVFAPVYVVWKMTLGRKRARRGDAEWVRTTREKTETAAER
jgi:cellulose synthase/poly-beta-1,6-N-acetylglucosamine synthase-like glycosyltransferase